MKTYRRKTANRFDPVKQVFLPVVQPDAVSKKYVVVAWYLTAETDTERHTSKVSAVVDAETVLEAAETGLEIMDIPKDFVTGLEITQLQNQ